MINALHKYLQKEIKIVQTYKDRELRIGAKKKYVYFGQGDHQVQMFAGQMGN